MRKRGFSLDESGEWVQRKKKTEREELREKQDEEFEKGKAEDIKKRRLEDYQNDVTTAMISPIPEHVMKCLGTEENIRELLTEEEIHTNKCMLIPLVSSLMSQWLVTNEDELQDTIHHVLHVALQEDTNIEAVKDFMCCATADPDLEDYNYRHRVYSIARRCGEILDMDFAFVALQKKEEWMALQASARPSTSRT